MHARYGSHVVGEQTLCRGAGAAGTETGSKAFLLPCPFQSTEHILRKINRITLVVNPLRMRQGQSEGKDGVPSHRPREGSMCMPHRHQCTLGLHVVAKRVFQPFEWERIARCRSVQPDSLLRCMKAGSAASPAAACRPLRHAGAIYPPPYLQRMLVPFVTKHSR